MPNEPTRVLLMEDDAGLAHLCRKALEKAGYAVEVARDGEQGLAMYEAGAFDVVALDHTMPVYDGLEVIRLLAARGALPPIVMVTGSGNERTAVEAMKLGAYDYVVKDAEAVFLDLLPEVIAQALRRRSVEERVRLAAKVFESAAEGIVVTDSQARIVSVNQAFAAITGYSAEEVIGKNPRLLQSGRHDEKFYKQMWGALIESGGWHGEIWNRRKNGEAYPAWLTVSAVKDDRGRISHYAGIFSDITAHKQTEERLRHLATHDALTGLPNRELFRDRLAQVLYMAHRQKRMAAVMMLDLDRFKPINDSLGHATGDRVLQGVAERLRQCLRDCDTAARLGGDEFAILLPAVSDPQATEPVAQRILAAISKPFILGNRECATSASIGISLYPDHGETVAALLSAADSAMYGAKKRRNCSAQFQPEAVPCAGVG